MSLQVDGVWKGGLWSATIWADGVWREGAPVNIWTDLVPVTTTWTDAGINILQGGSMIGFIMSSNGIWTDKEDVTTTWTDI